MKHVISGRQSTGVLFIIPKTIVIAEIVMIVETTMSVIVKTAVDSVNSGITTTSSILRWATRNVTKARTSTKSVDVVDTEN